MDLTGTDPAARRTGSASPLPGPPGQLVRGRAAAGSYSTQQGEQQEQDARDEDRAAGQHDTKEGEHCAGKKEHGPPVGPRGACENRIILPARCPCMKSMPEECGQRAWPLSSSGLRGSRRDLPVDGAAELMFTFREGGEDLRHVDSIWPIRNVLDMTPGGRGNEPAFPALSRE